MANRRKNTTAPQTWVSSAHRGGLTGTVDYMKKASRMMGGFFGAKYKTMQCTIPEDNPKRLEIYDSEKDRNLGKVKRKIVFDSLVEFRQPSTVDSKNADSIDICIEE